MIVLTLVLMAISLFVFVVMNRQKEAIWLSGLFISFAMTNIGLMFYYAKMGGLTYREQILFFLDSGLQEKIRTAPVLLDSIARFLNCGKQFFVYFSLMFSLHISGKLIMQGMVYVLPLLPVLFNCIISDPFFYTRLPLKFQVVADICNLACIAIYSFISLVFLLRTYSNFQIRWIRQKLRYIILFVFNLMLYFFFFCQVNAVSIFYSNHILLQNLGFKIYLLRFSIFFWVLVIGIFIFFLISGLHSLFLYAKVNIDENREEISLERQLTTAGMGIQVFIHGIKNQLLAEQILLTHMKQDLEQANEVPKMKTYVEELTSINKNMSSRIEVLYKVFKHNSMTLTPQNMSNVIALSVEMLSRKMAPIQCQVSTDCDCCILADANYLSEAIYNILLNAVEAIHLSDHADQSCLSIQIKESHRWCIVIISDNGIGMSREKLKRIFEPFYTDKNTNYSWGIGLSYVRQTVKYHFGRLNVESQEGIGTTFTLAFPIYTQKKKKGQYDEQTQYPTYHHGPTTL